MAGTLTSELSNGHEGQTRSQILPVAHLTKDSRLEETSLRSCWQLRNRHEPQPSDAANSLHGTSGTAAVNISGQPRRQREILSNAAMDKASYIVHEASLVQPCMVFKHLPIRCFVTEGPRLTNRTHIDMQLMLCCSNPPGLSTVPEPHLDKGRRCGQMW
jgi:hypothetical protein